MKKIPKNCELLPEYDFSKGIQGKYAQKLATHNFTHNFPEMIAMSVSFTDDMICLLLTDGREVKTPIEYYPRLAGATNEQLNNFRFLGDGRGIHWEALDEDLSVESIVLGRRANTKRGK